MAKDIRTFILAVVDAAITDAQEGVNERAPRNTASRLAERLNLDAYRTNPRNGDAKCARSIYTAARWLYDTEQRST